MRKITTPLPTIQPFRAIHPSPEIAGEVAVQVESLSLQEAKSIRKQNPLSYINMLVPSVENPFGRGSKKELAFKKINENLDEFIDKGILRQDAAPSIYVYRTEYQLMVQEGIWTVTNIDDYLNNTIRRHELTREERERGLVDYLRQTGIDANPVLITYLPDEEINRLVKVMTRAEPILRFTSEGRSHELWQVREERTKATLVSLFAALATTYIADGHHRAAAACSYGMERRKLNLKHTGKEEYNFFNSVYIPANQLKITSFNRLVSDLGKLSNEEFLDRIATGFIVALQPATPPVVPSRPGNFGMYLAGSWYSLTLRIPVHSPLNPVEELDVTLLQDRLLEPVLGISDPRNDKRLHFTGGTGAAEVAHLVDQGSFAVGFTLYPTSIQQLIRVADAGEVMPPKSTWFEPKFQAGLVVHKID